MNQRMLKLATRVGVPVATLLDTVRQVGGIQCSYCQLGTQVLRHVGRLGEDYAIDLLKRILAAKRIKDEKALAALTREFHASKTRILPKR